MAAAKAPGSPSLTPKRSDSINFGAPSAAGKPIANPVTAIIKTSRSTIQITASRRSIAAPPQRRGMERSAILIRASDRH